MCSSSYIGDYAHDWIPKRYDWINPSPIMPITIPVDAVPRAEFDRLKMEVEELRKLLAAANKFDEVTGQHECERAEKIAFLKKIAEFVGVDLSAVLVH